MAQKCTLYNNNTYRMYGHLKKLLFYGFAITKPEISIVIANINKSMNERRGEGGENEYVLSRNMSEFLIVDFAWPLFAHLLS